jgi:hypothetical protein
MEGFNAQVDAHFEYAAFLGTGKQDGSGLEQRDDARRAGEKVIEESKASGAQGIWRRLHNRWAAPLNSLKDAARWVGHNLVDLRRDWHDRRC